MVGSFYKAAVSNELANAEPSLLGEPRFGSCEPLVIAFSSTDQYVDLLPVSA